MAAPRRPPRVKPIITEKSTGSTKSEQSGDDLFVLYDSVGVAYAKPQKSRDYSEKSKGSTKSELSDNDLFVLYDTVGEAYEKSESSRDCSSQIGNDEKGTSPPVPNEEGVYTDSVSLSTPVNKTGAVQNNLYGQQGGLYAYDNSVDKKDPDLRIFKARNSGISSYDTLNRYNTPINIQQSEDFTGTGHSVYSLQRPLLESPVKQSASLKYESIPDSSPESHKSLRASLPLSVSHSIKVEDDKIKVILELKTQSVGDETFDRVPMRLVCLFDTSGSMAQKFGSQEKGYNERPTKLKKMKNVAKIITQTLEDTDFLGILSFGGDTEMIWPLTENKASVKKTAFSEILKLGKSGLSLTTNLSRGVFAALEMFREDSKQRGIRCFDTRDVIVILTDGDINDGITDGQKLVKEVRKAIRDLEMEGRHYSREPSLTISTVVTGNNVSNAVYLLSKTCGSDAYYYIDKDTGALEIGTLMPVLLRKTCAASNISIQVSSIDPAEIIPKLCSHEYMAHRPHDKDDELNYFLNDLSVGMSKHLLVVLDKESVMAETDLNATILSIDMKYRNSLMQKQSLQYEISRRQILPNHNVPSQNVAVSIQDIRRISQIALRDVADFIKTDHPELAASALLQSTEDVTKVMENFSENLGEACDMKKLTEFAQSVTSSLAYLVDMVVDSQCSAGENWSAVKAVSSAISREAPSATKLLSQDKDLKASINRSEEYSDVQKVIRDQYSKRGIKSAIFYDFDVTMSEMTNSLSRGAGFPSDFSERSEMNSPRS